jgi:hypothetical protein
VTPVTAHTSFRAQVPLLSAVTGQGLAVIAAPAESRDAKEAKATVTMIRPHPNHKRLIRSTLPLCRLRDRATRRWVEAC